MSEQQIIDVKVPKDKRYLLHNIITFIGFVTTVIFRLWGFSAFLCALMLYILRAHPKQYLGIIVADIISAGVLYFNHGFYTPLQDLTKSFAVFSAGCFVYWLLTLEKSPPQEDKDKYDQES
jgi:hypothetical protein